jgi:tRNA dimethylallyltransferase
VAVVGPTSSGKSALGLALAERFGGEVVSADSRAVYRHMDIGTAKPTPDERRRVPHHLIDVVDPDEEFSVARYRELALAALEDIWGRGRLPILVGGTGLYVQAVLGGRQAPPVPPDPDLRAALEERARREGPEALYAELVAVDPDAATRIHPHNVRRMVRALEVWHKSGFRFSEQGRAEPPEFSVLLIGISTDRKELFRRIDQRIDDMLAAGWLDEVARLLAMGYSPDLRSFSGHGYRELAAHLRGEMTLDEARARVRGLVHKFARSQPLWFPRDAPNTVWVDSLDPQHVEKAAAAIEQWHPP